MTDNSWDAFGLIAAPVLPKPKSEPSDNTDGPERILARMEQDAGTQLSGTAREAALNKIRSGDFDITFPKAADPWADFGLIPDDAPPVEPVIPVKAKEPEQGFWGSMLDNVQGTIEEATGQAINYGGTEGVRDLNKVLDPIGASTYSPDAPTSISGFTDSLSSAIIERADANKKAVQDYRDREGIGQGLDGGVRGLALDVAANPDVALTAAASLIPVIGEPLAAVAATIPTARVFLNDYYNQIKQGVPKDEAKAHALAQSAVEYGAELTPGMKFLHAGGALTSTGRKIVTKMFEEFIQEGGTELAQDGMDNLISIFGIGSKEEQAAADKNKFKSVEDAASRITYAGLVGSVAAGGMTAIPAYIQTAAEDANKLALLKQDLNKHLAGDLNSKLNATIKEDVIAGQDVVDQATELDKEAQKERDFTENSADSYSAEQKAAEEEAAKRTFERQRTADKLSTNPAFKVAPVEPVTPEEVQVQAERQQAKEAEAADAKRVELGSVEERIRTRQKLAADKVAADAAAAEVAQKKAEAATKRLKTIHENIIIDRVAAENPEMDHTALAPLVTEALAAEPFVAPAPAVVAEPTAKPKKGGKKGKAKPTLSPQAAEAVITEAAAKANPLQTPANNEPVTAGTQAELDSLFNQLGVPTVKSPKPDKLAMAGTEAEAETEVDPESFHGKQIRFLKGLIARRSKTSNDVQNLVHQGKLIVAPNAKSIGRDDEGKSTDPAEYDVETGKMYIYLDHINPDHAASSMVAALHESTHAGQFNGRDGRSNVLKQMMGQDKYNEASKKIREAAAAGNKLAQEAVAKAVEASKVYGKDGKWTGEYNETLDTLELVPYFVGAVAAKREGTALGRVGGIARDIRNAGRSFLRKGLGINLDLSMNDLHVAAMQVAGEVAKTDIKGSTSDEGSLKMIAGRLSNEYDKDNPDNYKGSKDNKTRFEFSDEAAEINPDSIERLEDQEELRLEQVLFHPLLFKNYPWLRNLPVEVNPSFVTTKTYGSYNGPKAGILLSPDILYSSGDLLISTVLHEVQHAIQNFEGFIPGASQDELMSKVAKREYNDSHKDYNDSITTFEFGTALKTLPPSIRGNWGKQLDQLGSRLQRNPTHNEMVLRFLQLGYAGASTDSMVRRQGDNFLKAETALSNATTNFTDAEKKARSDYERSHGEAEARNTEHRRTWNDARRKANPPESTMKDAEYNVAVEDTIDTRKRSDLKATPKSLKMAGDNADLYVKQASHKFTPEQLHRGAEVIRNMSEDERDNLDPYEGPAQIYAYELYEAQKLMPKPAEKFKKLTDSNSFKLHYDFSHLANVDGVLYGMNQEEDPDDENEIVWSYERIDDPNRTRTETVRSDQGSAIRDIREAHGNAPAITRLRMAGDGSGRTEKVTDSKNFKNWFKNSKVVTRGGEPRVMYHGTDAEVDFDTFRNTWKDIGMHFGTKAQANHNRFIFKSGDPNALPRVIPVYLSIQKPLRMDDVFGSSTGEGFVDELKRNSLFSKKQIDTLLPFLPEYTNGAVSVVADLGRLYEAAIKIIKEEGYDGIVYENHGEPEYIEYNPDGYGVKRAAYEDSYIVFDPEQIKSAIGNNGDFDPKNPSYLKMANLALGPELPFTRKIPPIISAFLSSSAGAGRVVREIMEHAISSPAGQRMISEGTVGQYRRGVKKVARERGVSTDAINKEITTKINAIDTRIDDYDTNLAAFKEVVGKYGQAGEALITLRNQADELSFQMIRERAAQGTPLTADEVETYTTIRNNMGRYSHRQYAVNMGKGGKQYADTIFNDYETYVKTKGVKASPKIKANFLRVARAVKQIVDNNLVIPDDEALMELDATEVGRLFDQWGGKTNPEAYSLSQQRSLLSDRRDAVNANTAIMKATAEHIVKEILGIIPTTSPIAQNFRGGKIDQSILKERTWLTPEMRALMGEIEDPAVRLMSTVAKQTEFIARSRMLTELRDNVGPEHLQPPGPAGRPEVNGMKRLEGDAYGSLQNHWVSENLANMLVSHIQTLATFEQAVAMAITRPDTLTKLAGHWAVQTWGKIASIAKMRQIIYKPVNFAFNFIGGPRTLILNGNLNPAHVIKAMSTAANLIAYSVNPSISNAEGRRVTSAGVTDSAFVGEITGEVYAELKKVLLEMQGKTPSKAKEILHKSSLFAKEGYAMMDVVYKIANFYHQADAVLPAWHKAEGNERTQEQIDREAADIVNDTNITYKRAAPIIKNLEKYGGTQFGVFFAEVFRTEVNNVKQGVKELKRAKGSKTTKGKAIMYAQGSKRLLGQLAVWGATAALSRVLASMVFGDDDDKERKLRSLLPSYLQNQDFVIPGITKDGKSVLFDWSRVDPSGPMTDIMRTVVNQDGDIGKIYDDIISLYVAPRIGGRLLQAIATSTGLAHNKIPDPITKDLLPHTFENALSMANKVGIEDNTVKAWALVAETMLPGITAGWATNNARPVVNNMSSAIGAIATYAGARMYTLDTDKAINGAAFDHRNAMKENRSDINVYINEHPNADLTEVVDKLSDLRDKEKDSFDKLQITYDGMVAVGRTPKEVADILQGKKISIDIIKDLRKGEFHFRSLSKASIDGFKKAEKVGKTLEQKRQINDKWNNAAALLRAGKEQLDEEN